MREHTITVPRYHVYTKDGSFNRGMQALRNHGIPLCEAKELFAARIAADRDDAVNREGSWVANPFLYSNTGNADILVVRRKYDPLIRDAEAATAAHAREEEFSVQKIFAKYRARAERDPMEARKSGVFLFSRKLVRDEIPVSDFDAYELTVFLAGTQVKPYGERLGAEGIDSVPLYVVAVVDAKNQEQPFARALWIGSLGGGSGLGGDGGSLRGDDGRVRGVRRIVWPAERAAQNLEAAVQGAR